MCTVSSEGVGIIEFLAMENTEILKLPVNNCQTSQLYGIEFTVHGISHQINHPVTNQMLALKYFVNRFEYSADRARLFEIVIPKLTESLSALLQSSQLDVLSSLISSVTLTICDTFNSTRGDSSEVLQSLAIGVLDLLLQLYKLIYERIKCQQDDAIQFGQLEIIVEKHINVIQSKLFDFLISNEASYFQESFTSNDVTFINRLIFILCGMAEHASKAENAKFYVAVWQCIIAFCLGKVSKSISDGLAANNDLNCFEFLLSVVKTGCYCIQYGLRQLCESSSTLSGKFHSRIISFTSSILKRLAVTYPHHRFKGHGHILTTLLILMRTIRTQYEPNEFLNQSLCLGLQDVLQLICKSDEFFECFRLESCDEFPIELLQIGLDITKKLMDDNHSDFLNYFMKDENVNIVRKMLDCLSVDPSRIFGERNLYKHTIETLSGILIKVSTVKSAVNPNTVPHFLVKSLLKCNNIFLGYILFDFWIIWISCLSEEQRYNLILFLAEINEKLSIVQHRHLSTVHVKVLLRNLYDSLSDVNKLRLASIKSTLCKTEWEATLGLQRIKSDANEIADLHTKIDNTLKAFLAERTESALYKLIQHLRVLETMPQANATSVPHYLIELWNLNLDYRPNKYFPLIIPLIRISIAYQSNLNNSQYFQILRKITAIIGSPNVSTLLKLEVLNYLRHISVKYFTVEYQNEILKSIQQLFNKGFTDSDPIVKKAAFMAYASVIQQVQHEVIQPDNIIDDENVKMALFDFVKKQKSSTKNRDEQMKFLQNLSSYSFQHRCTGKVVPTTDDNPRCESNEIRMKEIIERMRSDTKELMELNRKVSLTEDFFKSIESMRQELASLK